MEWWEGPGALNYGGRAVLGFFAGVPPRVPSYATADGVGLPT